MGLLSTGSLEEKVSFMKSAQMLEKMGFVLYATKGTAQFLISQGVAVLFLHWPDEQKEPNILTYLKQKKIDLVINIPLITNIQLAKLFVQSITKYSEKDLQVKIWQEYI